jgi:hypothetical protein
MLVMYFPYTTGAILQDGTSGLREHTQLYVADMRRLLAALLTAAVLRCLYMHATQPFLWDPSEAMQPLRSMAVETLHGMALCGLPASDINVVYVLLVHTLGWHMAYWTYMRTRFSQRQPIEPIY